MEIHEKFLERMERLLGEAGLRRYLYELEKPSPRAFRLNTKKAQGRDAEDYFNFPLSPVPYAKNAYYFSEEKIGAHPLHHAGLIYVQEPGAMVPVSSVNIEAGWKILDTCAAPGGKSLQAAALLGDGGYIISNEISPARAKIMAGNFERMGEMNYAVTCTDTDTLTRSLPRDFDLVIADAPCSGEGMFRKEEAARTDWSEEYVLVCAERQKEILQNASRAVADGGYLLYSTCTFSTEENEDVVMNFLKDNPDFYLVEPNDNVLPYTMPGSDERMRRFYPHIAPGEGQFSALMKRSGERETVDDTISQATMSLTPEERKITEAFLDDALTGYDKEKLFKFKDYIVYIDPKIPVPREITYSCGVTLGEIKKGIFHPHHQLFSALGNLFRRALDLPLDDKRVNTYLLGETIEARVDNGWIAVKVNGVSLGGGKVVNGQIKNHYPKGLRIKH